ncbi:alpha/beta hydrolase [Gilvibacter sediminis]|uniref:alpha/beta hydrolase n=1 Tax=Gilvibacter sediminis TaxID=379071 RepID=UPI00234FE226|nr:alpha/beta hydrolase [Gilvibacter sediminis]MDC7997914.1 alpha/beta hydrolase [Gilvibacter sediminis]
MFNYKTPILYVLTALLLLTGFSPINSSFRGFEEISIADLENSATYMGRSVMFSDISYGDGEHQRYDIYLPVNRDQRKTKVLILLHGGSWMHGDKLNLNGMVSSMLERMPNVAIVNMNYTLASADNFAFPTQFLDIGKVIDHVTALSNSFDVMPEFGIIGRSSGGHLGLMYDSVFDTDDRVKFVTSLAGPTDFTDPYLNRADNFELLFDLLVDPEAYGTNPLETLSPIHNINIFTSPRLLIYGQDDKKVPMSNGLNYLDALQHAGVESHLLEFDAGHSNVWSEAQWNEVFNQIQKGISLYLK